MTEHRTPSVRIGDISSLREELKDDKIPRQRAALLKLLELDLHAAKDLPAGIFREVLMVRHQERDGVELKKLMYCFFQMTAEALQQSDTVKDVIYNVRRDLTNANPVVRAMAAKFAGHLAAQSQVSELLQLLKGSLNDSDPFVRKTAVVSVGRLYRLLPGVGETLNLLEALEAKLQDDSAMVAINALATLRDLQATIGTELKLNTVSVRALLLAMSEGSEWNQIVVLEAVSQFTAADDSEASVIVERVLPSLNHANSAVVLTAARVLLTQMETRGGPTWNTHSLDWANKMLKALERCTASADAGIQWVVMKCLMTIVQRWPELAHMLDVRNFFLKYDDPAYIKQQKLDLLQQLISEANIDRVLLELREYAGDADVAVARRSVECMGAAALRLQSCAEKVVTSLMELMTAPKGNAGGSHNSMVQAVVPTMTKIFRAYPMQYEGDIGLMCDNMCECSLTKPEAKAALLWIIGEYADFVVDPVGKLRALCDNLEAESGVTQLAVVTAVTKVYLKVPTEQGSQLALSVLERFTKLDNPDVRHRAFFYWHMLSTDPQMAKDVVLATRPALDFGDSHEVSALIRALAVDVPNLATVYGVDPNTMGFTTTTTSGGSISNGQLDSVVLDSQASDISLSKVNSADVAALEKRDESGLLEPISTLSLEDSAPGTVEERPRPQTDSLIDLLDDDLMPTPVQPTATPAAPKQAAPDANDPFALLGGPVLPVPVAAPSMPSMPVQPAMPAMPAPQPLAAQQTPWGQPAAIAVGPSLQAPTTAPREAPSQGGWIDFQPGAVPTPAAPISLPPAAPHPPLPPLNTHPPAPPAGNPFASTTGGSLLTSPTSSTIPPTPTALHAHILPPMSPNTNFTGSTNSSISSSINQLSMSQANPYASISSVGASSEANYQQGGYGGYGGGMPAANGGADYRPNGSWQQYSPQTTGGAMGMPGYGGYVAQHTGGFSQFNSATYVDPRASQQAVGGYGQPVMQGGYTLQHTGGSMYGGYGGPAPSGNLLLNRQAGQGLEIYGQFVGSRSSGGIYLQLHLTNFSHSDMSGFLIQFNKNQLGLAPVQHNIQLASLPPGSSRTVDVPCTLQQSYVNQQASSEMQIALKTAQVGPLFFRDSLPMHIMQ